jgi:hypothetical protein
MMDDKPLAVLIEQLDAPWEILDARLTRRKPWSDEKPNPEAFLTDDEYFWEPVDSCWSLRRRGEASSPRPRGKGEWLLDGATELPREERVEGVPACAPSTRSVRAAVRFS